MNNTRWFSKTNPYALILDKIKIKINVDNFFGDCGGHLAPPILFFEKISGARTAVVTSVFLFI